MQYCGIDPQPTLSLLPNCKLPHRWRINLSGHLTYLWANLSGHLDGSLGLPAPYLSGRLDGYYAYYLLPQTEISHSLKGTVSKHAYFRTCGGSSTYQIHDQNQLMFHVKGNR